MFTIEFAIPSCSDSWVSELQKAAESVSTKADAKTAVSAGDAKAAQQAFVGAVSSLQTWASVSGIQVKGL